MCSGGPSLSHKSRPRTVSPPRATIRHSFGDTHAECFHPTRRVRMALIIRCTLILYTKVDVMRVATARCLTTATLSNSCELGEPILVRTFLSPRVPFASARPRPAHLAETSLDYLTPSAR